MESESWGRSKNKKKTANKKRKKKKEERDRANNPSKTKKCIDPVKAILVKYRADRLAAMPSPVYPY